MTRACEDHSCSCPGGLCPLWKNVSLFEKKWTLRIIHELRQHETQFNELKRQLGVTASVLSQRLKELETEGLVIRNHEAYSIAPQFLNALGCWEVPQSNH